MNRIVVCFFLFQAISNVHVHTDETLECMHAVYVLGFQEPAYELSQEIPKIHTKLPKFHLPTHEKDLVPRFGTGGITAGPQESEQRGSKDAYEHSNKREGYMEKTMIDYR
jgi:hypothetical protein